MTNTDLELLAPAGKWDVLESVAQAGADAVYAGGKRFNMRMLRPDFNFSDWELKKAVDYLHEQGKHFYVTVNNLYYEDEMAELKDYLYYLQEIKVDGLIIQDLATAALHQELGLTVPMHASVQMNIGSSSAVDFLESLGFSRVILSKNLTLKEIEVIHQKTSLGLEFFIHGDMCVSHTGHCLFSSLIAGESGNRGRCRKPCRWKYQLELGSKSLPFGYYLAHKDLCLYPYLRELIQAGVTSFKIEGRMRDADYLGFLVRTYRQALDRFMENPDDYQTDPEAMHKLQENRIRDFTCGELFGPIELDSIGVDGTREPKFPTAPVKVVALGLQDFTPQTIATQTIPEIVVKVGDMEGLQKLARQPVSYFILGLEKMQPGNRGWTWPELVNAMEYCQEQGLSFVVETPRIVMEKDMPIIQSYLDRLEGYSCQAVMVNDLGTLQEARERGYILFGGPGLNISNTRAGQLLRDQGLVRFTASQEASFGDLLALLDSDLVVDLIVHGPQCALITDLCLLKAAAGDTERPCSVHCGEDGAFLCDELGQYYEIRSDEYCRNYVFLPQPLSLYNFLPILTKAQVNGLRIEGQYMTPQELEAVVNIYQEGLNQLSRGEWDIEPYQRLLSQYPKGITSGWFAGRNSL
ncbi:MAG TPA: U32 family peptidase [Syntrophomonadaceae bacterium]|nr:U32 family peptidase [Syntrophomonadaceae bacterium]HPU47745.1 U32 family peptidase [Syntrophomonadaceae bacterium]